MALIEFKDYPNTSTPLNAENLNNNFNELNRANIYSTEEQVVGTWMGKPLYRKVIIANNISISNATTIATGITNADTITECRGKFKNSYSGLTLTYPLVQNSGTILSCNFLNGDIVFQGNETYSSSSDRTHIFTLEYTKTTD